MGKKVINNYIEKGDLTELHIEGSVHGDKIVLIDTEDKDKIKQYNWTINKFQKAKKIYYYAVASKGMLLHRFIMNANEGRKTTVDHINDDTLDNRKNNLQICTHQENLRKARLKSTNKTGVTGVCWSKTHEKWIASIKYNRKHITIGYYDSIEEALEARINYENKIYKNFSPNRENQKIYTKV